MTMNGLFNLAAAALFLVLALVPAAVAVTFTVGDSSGWASGVDYTTWVAGKTFIVGDTLVFTYGASHSVSVVNKAGYDNCDDTSATEVFSGGDNQIELKTVGTKYFLCPTPGHCISGMKLAIPVIAVASPPPTSFPVASPPPTPASPPPSLSVPPPPPPPTPHSPPTDGTHEAASGSNKPPPPPPPPPPSPPPLSSGAPSGLLSYIVVRISLVLAYNVWIIG